MGNRYWTVFPWDFEGKDKADEAVDHYLMQSWASFLWGYIHPNTHHSPARTKNDVTQWLAQTTVRYCMQYGDKMTLGDWNYMIDKLLSWLSDIESAKAFEKTRHNISSEYRWYGVFAWHELEMVAEDVKSEILKERIRVRVMMGCKAELEVG